MKTTPQPEPRQKLDWGRIGIGVGCSALTTGMLLLSFHPYNVWPLAFLALVPMFVAQYRLFPTRLAGLGSAIGVGGWLLIFLTRMFGSNQMGLIILMIVGIIVVIQMATIPEMCRFQARTGYRWFVIHGVIDWVGAEMIRSFIPPINTHAFMAQTMYTQPWMLQPISIFSIYGLSILLLLVNVTLAQSIIAFGDSRWSWAGDAPRIELRVALRWLAAAGVILVGWIIYGQVILATAPAAAPQIHVAAVQHNYPRPGHQDPTTQLQRLDALAEQTRAAAQQGAQLIVWPELGLGFDPQVEHTAEFQALAAETGAYLLIGYGIDDPRGWRNEMVMLTPEGQFLAVYGKNHPTTPGEPPIISAGVYPVYETPMGRVATLICNDVHWTDTARRLTLNGAQLIAVPTLETPGIALEQIAQSVLRAVENRVAVVKTDVAYAAAIIDPYGRILAQRNGSPAGAAFALVAAPPLGAANTLYTRLGDWVGWLSLGGWIFFIIYPEIVKRRMPPQ